VSGRWRERMGEWGLLLHLSARSLAGRRFWIWPLVTVTWPALQILFLLVGWRQEEFGPQHAQNMLIGIPLLVLGILFGVQVIAGEIDRRTLEIAYTVPGGTHRVWLFKLAAGFLLLLPAAALLALVTFVFCTEFPPSALYGALQAALFYMVLAMGLSVLSRSEAAGALLTGVVLTFNALILQGAGSRTSPFWNPENFDTADPADVLAWTVQNRIGILIAIVALTLLAFARAEQRERVLGH